MPWKIHIQILADLPLLLHLRPLPVLYDLYEAVITNTLRKKWMVSKEWNTEEHKNRCPRVLREIQREVNLWKLHLQPQMSCVLKREYLCAQQNIPLQNIQFSHTEINTMLPSLPFTWTIIFCGPARSPILWQSWILNLRDVDNQSQPHCPCTRYSSPFCFHTFKTTRIQWQEIRNLKLKQVSHQPFNNLGD